MVKKERSNLRYFSCLCFICISWKIRLFFIFETLVINRCKLRIASHQCFPRICFENLSGLENVSFGMSTSSGNLHSHFPKSWQLGIAAAAWQVRLFEKRFNCRLYCDACSCAIVQTLFKLGISEALVYLLWHFTWHWFLEAEVWA